MMTNMPVAQPSSTRILVEPPELCDFADLRLAHELMRRHRACRAGRCLWKSAAHHTLALAGHLAPQSKTPRERAAERGVDFPAVGTDGPPTADGPPLRTLREVLDRLTELGRPNTNEGI
ncbi:hypothetical protein [Nocardia wallacei]|uniref:hypothetical protein n=3 Tax=Nocardia wallacei TaxID=480035 RepID=UPI0024573560|nr:hypothetical protein [Nocardia wallacei]